MHCRILYPKQKLGEIELNRSEFAFDALSLLRNRNVKIKRPGNNLIDKIGDGYNHTLLIFMILLPSFQHYTNMYKTGFL